MPNGYDPSTFPTSYKDPAYDQADQAASAAVGIPAAWLNSIRTQGEKSNADQISSAQAATPYQITPPTRQAIIKQTGVDPYLNPQNAAYGAAYLLKQNLDRYGGNPVLATAAYHGGTDQSNWGTKTMAYAKRVTGASPNNPDATPSWGSSNPYQVQALPQIGAAPGAVGNQPVQPGVGADPYAVQPLPNVGQAPGAVDAGPSALQQAFQAYQSGKMDPADKAQFEQDVSSGRIVLPTGMNVNAPQAAPSAPAVPTAPQAAVDAFNSGKMDPADASQFQKDVQGGAIMLPQGASLTPQQPATLGREAGLTARSAIQGIGDTLGIAYDPIAATINTAGRMIGHDPHIGTAGGYATQAANALGLPTPQNASERIAQGGIQAGASMGAFPVGITADAVKAIPTMIAAGASGGAVGEAVHQATGNPLLGGVANLLTAALSPAVASKVMGAIFKELPEAATAARVEPTLSAAPGGTAAAEATPAANSSAAAATPSASQGLPLGTRLNPGVPQVPNPTAATLQQERESLLPIAANAPAKGDTSIQDQIAALEGRSFDSVSDRTKQLQSMGMKFGDARALAQKQLAGEMSGYQDQMARLQSAQDQQAEGSRALQRLQQIDQQLAQVSSTAPAAENPIAAAARQTLETPAPVRPSQAEPIAESMPEEVAKPATAQPQQEVPQLLANPSSSPLASAAQDFMPPDQLAAQTRKATGAQGAPFGIGKQTAQQTLAAQMAPDAERLAAAERLGIADNLQPDHLTTNQAAIELAQAIKSTPGSAARAQEMEGLQQVGQRASQVIDDAGGTRDLSDLSAQVKSEMMNTQQQLDQKGEQLYSELRSMVPPKMSVNPDNVLSFISQRSDELGGAKNLSPIERMIQSKLTPREVPTTINGQQIDPAVLGLKPQTEGPSYALLDDVRKNIGAGLKNQGPFKDADTGLLKALYGRISDDQRAALGNVPGAVEKFDTARAAVQMRKSMEDDLTSLFGKQLGDSLVGKLGAAVSSLNKGDETKLVNLLKAVPSNLRQQVMASGLSYAFGKATRNGELNFKTYADFWDSLMKNSRAANAVLGNLPAESRQQLADLAKVSRGISNATRETITTGRIMAARDSLNGHADGLLRNIYGIARQAAISRIGSAVTGGAAAVGGPVGAGLAHALMSVVSKGKPDVMKAADELISSPEFQRLTREGSNVSPQTIKEIANTPRMRRFYDAAKDMSAPSDPASRARWLQGVVNAANQNTNDRTNR